MQNQPINEIKRVVLLVIGITSGCTTGSETQPSRARDGFYDIGAGVYNNRIEEQEGRLEEVRHLQREARQEQRRLAADNNIKQLKINEKLDQELFRLTQETHQLAGQLTNFKPNNTQAAEKKSLIIKKLKQVNLDIEQLQRDLLINRAAIATHQQQIMQLDKEIQQLWRDFQRLP